MTTTMAVYTSITRVLHNASLSYRDELGFGEDNDNNIEANIHALSNGHLPYSLVMRAGKRLGFDMRKGSPVYNGLHELFGDTTLYRRVGKSISVYADYGKRLASISKSNSPYYTEDVDESLYQELVWEISADVHQYSAHAMIAYYQNFNTKSAIYWVGKAIYDVYGAGSSEYKEWLETYTLGLNNISPKSAVDAYRQIHRENAIAVSVDRVEG